MAFAQLLWSAVLSLPAAVMGDLLMNLLKEGIPARLIDNPHLITGSCDEVVKIFVGLIIARYQRESVCEID